MLKIKRILPTSLLVKTYLVQIGYYIKNSVTLLFT